MRQALWCRPCGVADSTDSEIPQTWVLPWPCADRVTLCLRFLISSSPSPCSCLGLPPCSWPGHLWSLNSAQQERLPDP